MINTINKEGGNIKAYDPISNDNMKLIYPDIKYCSDWQGACKNADAVAVITEWNEFRSINLKVLSSLLRAPAVLDARNIFDISKLQENNFTYRNFGRQRL